MKLNSTRAYDVTDPFTDEPRVLVVQLSEEGIIADLFDTKFEESIETWGLTAQEFVDVMWGPAEPVKFKE